MKSRDTHTQTCEINALKCLFDITNVTCALFLHDIMMFRNNNNVAVADDNDDETSGRR